MGFLLFDACDGPEGGYTAGMAVGSPQHGIKAENNAARQK
jgi:hypothetical protein